MEPYKSSAGQGLGIAALILGIVSFVVSFIPCIGLLAIIPGIVAIILSIVALSQAQKENAAKGIVIAALIISILGTSIAILWSVFFASAFQKDSWLRQQIEKTIEDETGSSVDENIKNLGTDMEKKLEDLESNSDSTNKNIAFGTQMSDKEFDQFLSNYEKLIKESIKLKEKSKNGDTKAMEAYARVSDKRNGLLSKIATSGSKLTKEQAQKLENINKKYEKELESSTKN
jgi:biopolymer transport protein ExbB/TolQ